MDKKQSTPKMDSTKLSGILDRRNLTVEKLSPSIYGRPADIDDPDMPPELGRLSPSLERSSRFKDFDHFREQSPKLDGGFKALSPTRFQEASGSNSETSTQNSLRPSSQSRTSSSSLSRASSSSQSRVSPRSRRSYSDPDPVPFIPEIEVDSVDDLHTSGSNDLDLSNHDNVFGFDPQEDRSFLFKAASVVLHGGKELGRSFPNLRMRNFGSESDKCATAPKANKPKMFIAKKSKRLLIRMPNGELVEVANPPERSKDDSAIGSKNGQLSPTKEEEDALNDVRTGSLTVLKRSGSRGSNPSRTSSVVSLESEGYASIDLGTEKLPAIDTPEASHVCSIRLRHIVKKLQKDDISKEDLTKNLEYAASVLETVYIDETRDEGSLADSAFEDSGSQSNDTFDTQSSGSGGPTPRHVRSHRIRRHAPSAANQRRLCDEEDELSEVEPDAVPSEVRDWLALTFTRSMSNIKRRGDDKPKFRSVAHAIRAGIMVDRIYRRMSSTVGIHIPANVLLLLKNIDDWSFDVFGVNEVAEGHALKYVGYELLQRYDVIAKFKIQTSMLEAFLLRIEQGYSKHNNPYHNLVHAADVAQTTHYIMSQSGLALWLTDLEIFATIVAALIHDFEHTGTTNNFHINTGSDITMLYNDRAVLENHHISAAFRLMKEDEFNVLGNLKREEYREFRGLVIDMVLATDMSFHFQQIKNMKNLLSMPEKPRDSNPVEDKEGIDKSKALSLVLHCADISHPAKDWDLHNRWTMSLLEEFFRQGDREAELGLPYSPLCDRKNTLVAESQIGFIDFIVDPSFQVMGDMLEKIILPLHQRNTIAEECFTPSDKTDKATSTTSLSSRGSTPGVPRSPLSPGVKFEVKRVWIDCLLDNKTKWKDRAAKDAEERKKIAEAERQRRREEGSDDSGVESPNPAKDKDLPRPPPKEDQKAEPPPPPPGKEKSDVATSPVRTKSSSDSSKANGDGGGGGGDGEGGKPKGEAQ